MFVENVDESAQKIVDAVIDVVEPIVELGEADVCVAAGTNPVLVVGIVQNEARSTWFCSL